MASITTLTSSGSTSSSSIYGNRNVLSGLASGMDTETMIENAVSGYQTKISRLQQQYTKVEWQQEAYRSIIDKLATFNTKYTSYTSSTNLMSSSFFSNAVITTAQSASEANAAKITATGKTSSDISILGVSQMAKAATYTTTGLRGGITGDGTITGSAVDLTSSVTKSTINGTLSLQWGNTDFDITFGEDELYNSPEELAQAIRDKLGEQNLTYTNGGVSYTKKASELIDVTVDNGEIKFTDQSGVGNSVYIVSAYGNFKSTLGVATGTDSKSISVGSKALTQEVKVADNISGKTLNVTLDGVSKAITLPDKTESGQEYLDAMQDALDSAFGAGKIVVAGAHDDSDHGYADGNSFTLSLSLTNEGSTMSISGTGATAVGLKTGDATYVNTGSKLGDLLDSSFWSGQTPMKAEGDVKEVKTNDETYYVDSNGNRVVNTYDGWTRVDSDGNYLYDFQINGVSIGPFSKETPLESVMTAINSNADAGVKVTFSKLTNQFNFTTTETGSNTKIEFDGLAKALFGDPAAGAQYDDEGNLVSDYTAGQDLQAAITVNGQTMNITRSNNTFELDGLTVSVKGTFNYSEEYEYRVDDDGNYLDEAGNVVDNKEDAAVIGTKQVLNADAKDTSVSFETVTDSDKIIDAIRSLVEDYNEMITELKNAYSTQPLTNSSGDRYEPLTADGEEGLTESEIERYNEKAKTGILYMDSNLSSLYSKLLNCITPGGTDGQTLREIGIGTSYSDGLTTISLDEDALREALENDPDKVKNAFTKTTESGSSSDGLMTSFQNTLNTYVKTTGEPKGVLIVHAGSVKAPTSLNNNTLNSQLNSIQSQIERWQDKMSDQIDRYTTKFTRLETLIAEMNSQSSALMGLMGGGTSY